ncbi:DUF5990 family protein [Sphingomonas asaccharolytica]|uniref:DUF5990 family protein n=1 Tax=Sphingomonas asaccharolytica TaxID=40681 RepID=UPI000830BC76|nr:DUF5990 family protein [Sphingomonas asaccharolytica]
MTAEKSELPLRIVVDQPIPGVALALQRGSGAKFDLVGPVQASVDALVFDLDINVDGSTAAGGPRLLGPFVQGPPTARFVYINVGASAGQIGSPWQRRVKVPLGAIGWQAIEALAPGERLTAHIASRGRDGTPACATVPILPPGWMPRRSSAPG